MEKNNSQNKLLVSVRIRPFNEEENSEGSNICFEKSGQNKLQIKNKENGNLDKELTFNSVFNQNNSQTDIFENTTKYVLDGLFLGHNGTILTYGQTGTGKTYTMRGHVDNKGITSRSFDYIFEKIKLDKKHRYNLFLSSLQIYLETVYDLLEPKNTKIRIRQESDNYSKMKIEGIQWIKVTSTTDCLNALQISEQNKLKIENDNENVHDIILLRVESSGIGKAMNDINFKSTLFLVTLAGSEKTKRSKHNFLRSEEQKKVNYSLNKLGKCLSNSNYGSNYITCCSSKLTSILQDPLKGNSRISMIITISPSSSNLENTISDLYFGQTAMEFELSPIQLQNKEINYQSLSNRLQEDLDNLNDEYTKLRKEFDKLTEENQKNKDTIFTLQKQAILYNLNHYDELEINKLVEYYENKLNAQRDEHHILLCEIDKLLIEKEQHMNTITQENKNLKIDNEKLNADLEKIIQVKDELVKKLIDHELNDHHIGNDLKTNEKNHLDPKNLLLNTNSIPGKNTGIPLTKEVQIQTESEIMDLQLLELMQSIGRKGKSLSEGLSFKDNNAIYKLEYFIIRFEKEIFRLNKENKELKEKLKKNEEFALKIDGKEKESVPINTGATFKRNQNTNSYTFIQQDQINVNTSTSVYTQSKTNFKYSSLDKFSNLIVDKMNHYEILRKNQIEKLDAGVITLVNSQKNLGDNVFVKSIDFFIKNEYSYNDINNSNNKNINPTPKITMSTNNNDEESDDEESSEDLEQNTKILELNNEILKLKSLMLKKNKQIQEYEKIIDKHKLIEKELIVAKNDLLNISNYIKDSKSTKNSNDRLSTISKGSIDNKSMMNPSYNFYKYEYEEKFRTLNSAIEKLQVSCRSKQTDLELSKINESKLKKKIGEISVHVSELQQQLVEKEKDIVDIKEFYKLKLEKSLLKATNKKNFLIRFQNFMSNNLGIIENIKDYFGIFTAENKKSYISELFEKDLDFQNLDIYNYNIFLQKINSLNYIIKLDEQLNFDWLFYNPFSLSNSENDFSNSYNIFMKNFLNLFKILLKTLITENTKIFYLTSNLNKLIKTVILSKYDILILKNQLNGNNNSTYNDTKSISNNTLIQSNNDSDDYEYINSRLNHDKSNFEKLFENLKFEYKIIWLNEESISNHNQLNSNSEDNKNNNYDVRSFLPTLKDNALKLYFKTTQSFFRKLDERFTRTSSDC